MTGPGETAAAAPKGNAEALRQKGRTTTILRRVRPVRTPKVQPAPAGNLSGTKTEAQNCRKRFCAFLCVQNVSGACPSRRRGVSTMRPEGVQRLDKRSKRSKTSGTNDGINVIRRKEHERTQTHPAVRDPCGGRRLHGGFRRMGNARPISHGDRGGTSVHPALLQPVRCVPHGAAADPGTGAAGIFAARPIQQRGGSGSEHGPVLHPAGRGRRSRGRCVSLPLRGGAAPAGGERRQHGEGSDASALCGEGL